FATWHTTSFCLGFVTPSLKSRLEDPFLTGRRGHGNAVVTQKLAQYGFLTFFGIPGYDELLAAYVVDITGLHHSCEKMIPKEHSSRCSHGTAKADVSKNKMLRKVSTGHSGVPHKVVNVTAARNF